MSNNDKTITVTILRKINLINAAQKIMETKKISQDNLIQYYLNGDNGFKQGFSTIKKYLSLNKYCIWKIPPKFFNPFIKLFPEIEKEFPLLTKDIQLQLLNIFGQTEEEIIECEEVIITYIEKRDFENQKKQILEDIQTLNKNKLVLYNYFDEALKICTDSFYLDIMYLYNLSTSDYKDYLNQFMKAFNSIFNDLQITNKEILSIDEKDIYYLFSKKMDKKADESLNLVDFINTLKDYKYFITFFSNISENEWEFLYQLSKYEQHEKWEYIKEVLIFAIENSVENIHKKEYLKKPHYNIRYTLCTDR